MKFGKVGRFIKFASPVTVGGKTYLGLTVRPVQPKHLRTAPRELSDADTARLIVARACGVPLDLIRALEPADADRVLDLIEPMIRAG